MSKRRQFNYVPEDPETLAEVARVATKAKRSANMQIDWLVTQGLRALRDERVTGVGT